MAPEQIGERHLKLLEVLSELADGDADGVADMDKAAQKVGLNTVGKEEDRAEFKARAEALEEAGYVEKAGSDLAASYGRLYVTEEGRQQLQGS